MYLHFQQFSGVALFSSELQTSLLNSQKSLNKHNSLKSIECEESEGASNVDEHKNRGTTVLLFLCFPKYLICRRFDLRLWISAKIYIFQSF